MKILFPNEFSDLVCRKCKCFIGGPGYWDNEDAEDYWCDVCTDFVAVERVKKGWLGPVRHPNPERSRDRREV